MYYFSNFLRVFRIFTLLFGISCLLSGNEVYAKAVTIYQYQYIYNALPEEYRSEEYVYEADKAGYIRFATYNGFNYTTSIKKTAGISDYIYCMDFSKTVTPNKYFEQDNTLFNNELRSRIGIALLYGAHNWNELADSSFTTGNSVLDYYMTQAVIHGLIYQYAGDKSHYGINIKQLVYKDGTDALQRQISKFYNYCCNADVLYKDGHCQPVDFSFLPPNSRYLYLHQNHLYSNFMNCTYNTNNAEIDYYTRYMDSDVIAEDQMTIETKTNHYASSLRAKVTKEAAEKLTPGIYTVRLGEDIIFKRQIASFWRCSDAGYEDSQELGFLITNQENVADYMDFKLVIGAVNLLKRDSLTNEPISDAVFQIYQYNNNTSRYEYYKDMTYNTENKRYESGNIYVNYTNPSAKFKIIETKAGNNYINDWPGHEFTLTKDVYIHNVVAENQPILGSLSLSKKGEDFKFSNNTISNSTKLALKGIQFGVYAASDIYIKDKLIYTKNQQIIKLTTDSNGNAHADDLLPGSYYLKELNTKPLYHLNQETIPFQITRDNNRAYSKVKLNLINSLKKCSINIFKYTIKEEKLPLYGVQFGLYAKEPITNALGTVIIPKDTLIHTAFSDKDGNVSFQNLPYGDYYIKELSTPSGYFKTEQSYFVHKKDFKNKNLNTYDYHLSIENLPKNCNIKLFKFYTDSGLLKKKQPLENVTFGLYAFSDIMDSSGNCIIKQDTLIEKKTTSKDGSIEFSNLVYGNYYLKELEVPDGFVLDSNPIHVTEEEFDKNELTVIKEIENKPQKYKITILKYGEVFSNFKKESSDYGEFYSYNTDYILQKNVKFSLMDDNKKKIDTKTTNQNGEISFSNLLYGTYIYKEDHAPAEYKLNTEEKKVVCKSDDTSKKEIIWKENVYNELCECNIRIKKVGESVVIKNKGFEYTTKPLKDVVFGIYQTFDYKTSSQNILKKDSCVGYLITNQNGTANYTGKLPQGIYYIKELKTQNNYVLDDTKYYFRIKAKNNQTIQVSIGNQNTFYNKLAKSAIRIIKMDADTEFPLSGVEFTLYDQNNNEIGTYTTNRNGEIIVKNLPYGSYYFVETKCKDGYYSSNNKYRFTIDSEKIITLNITNTPIYKLGYEEHYKQYMILIGIILFLFLLFLICIHPKQLTKNRSHSHE